jgi:hypothetical protein
MAQQRDINRFHGESFDELGDGPVDGQESALEWAEDTKVDRVKVVRFSELSHKEVFEGIEMGLCAAHRTAPPSMVGNSPRS